jgi:hypothetical protein
MQGVPGALSLGVKRLGREAAHSSPFRAEVKHGITLEEKQGVRMWTEFIWFRMGGGVEWRAVVNTVMNLRVP